MSKPARLDAELVRRRLTASRTEAQEAIAAGLVEVNGIRVEKASTLVRADASLKLIESPAKFVSRGGDKLDGALARFDVIVAGKRWLDAGASTGGFTDRLLKGGAAQVIAIDVGYGQLDWRLRNDPRVIVVERTNVRHLNSDDLPWLPQGVVADLSFISLALVLPALARVASQRADYVLLVKPQFEVGRQEVGKGGVVRDPAQWKSALERVARAAFDEGLGFRSVVPSCLLGPAGNVEFFVHLHRDGVGQHEGILQMFNGAIREATE